MSRIPRVPRGGAPAFSQTRVSDALIAMARTASDRVGLAPGSEGVRVGVQLSFEEEALDLGRERLLREARARGFVRARVTTREVPTDGVRRLVFHVEQGSRCRDVTVAFPAPRPCPRRGCSKPPAGRGGCSPRSSPSRARWRPGRIGGCHVTGPWPRRAGMRLRTDWSASRRRHRRPPGASRRLQFSRSMRRRNVSPTSDPAVTQAQ